MSRLFAAAGAKVVFLDCDEAAAQGTAAEIEEAGGSVTAVVGDVRDRRVVDHLVERGLDGGRAAVDVLVNNVGDYRPNGAFVDTAEQDWAALYDINLLHVFRVTRAFLPGMVDRGVGSIVNVSTVEAFRGIPNNAVYSAMKAAVVAFTRSLAVELGPSGVRVNGIAPDFTDTAQVSASVLLAGHPPHAIRGWVPLGHFGTPADCAQVALFLASDQARFVTGQTIPVDGGALAASGWFRRHDGRGFTNRPVAP